MVILWNTRYENGDGQYEQSSGRSGKRARFQPRAERIQPVGMLENRGGLFDQAFGFQLCTQGNPDAIRRRDLGRKRLARGGAGVIQVPSGGAPSAGRDLAAETMELRSARKPWQAAQVARWTRASLGSCPSPADSRTNSNSLNCKQETPRG